MKRLVAIGVTALALSFTAPALGKTRYCGSFSYRVAGTQVTSNVYTLSGPVNCATARRILYATEVNGRYFPQWLCTVNGRSLVVTCSSRAARIRATTPLPGGRNPAGPGLCSDVQWAFGEYATFVQARAVGCNEARRVAYDDMSTPACYSECSLSEGIGGSDLFDCTPSGSPYGAYQDERCVTYDGGPEVTFTIVNGP